MKIYITTLFLIALFFTGCSDVKINTPPQANNEFALIPVPEASEESKTETQFTVSEIIDGAIGGHINFQKTYYTQQSGLVSVKFQLSLPPGAFTGTKTITVVLDDEFAVVACYPEMTFTKPLRMNYSYTGLNLLNLTGEVGFYFVANDGTFVPVPNSGVTLNRIFGKLAVHNAEITHFSRYGWATFD